MKFTKLSDGCTTAAFDRSFQTPNAPMMMPQATPPIIPSTMIGIHALVRNASGKLSSNPNNNPLTYIGKGSVAAPITKPIAKF